MKFCLEDSGASIFEKCLVIMSACAFGVPAIFPFLGLLL